MAFSIKYTIPEDDIRKLEQISQIDGYLQILRMNADWADLLETRARILEAVSSIGVEGTVVSFDDARALTVGTENPQVPEKARREYMGYYSSLQFVRDRVEEDLSAGLLLHIHEMITTGDANAQPGRFRNDLRSVQSDGEIVYTAPSPNFLNVYIREFIEWFNATAQNKTISPVVAGAICHFWFVWIHPFCDGNGRTARLLTTFLLLKKRSEGIRYFALSDYYNKNKTSYTDALKEVNDCEPRTPSINFGEDLTPWSSYFIDSYLVQMKELKEIANRILQVNIRIERLRRQGLITETHNKILSFLSSREKASYDELCALLGGVTRARVNQALKPLREAHILVEEKIGRLLWFKLGSPEEDADESALKDRFKKKLKTKAVDKKKPKIEAVPQQRVLPIFE